MMLSQDLREPVLRYQSTRPGLPLLPATQTPNLYLSSLFLSNSKVSVSPWETDLELFFCVSSVAMVIKTPFPPFTAHLFD